MRRFYKIITLILIACLAAAMMVGCDKAPNKEERQPKASPKAELNAYSWEEIKDLAACGLSEQRLRDEFNIKLGQTKDGFMLVDDDGNGYLSQGWIFLGPINQFPAGKMNAMPHNKGGYLGSSLKTALAEWYPEHMVNAGFGNAAEFINVKCINPSNNEVSLLQTKVFIPSVVEAGVYKEESHSDLKWGEEGHPFDYFENGGLANRARVSKICKGGGDWWLRTPIGDQAFACINREGNLVETSANSPESVLIAFVVGEPDIK